MFYKNRRSIREFNDSIVPREIVRDIIESAMWAPTSCNMQLYHFVIINSTDILERITKSVTGKINWCKQLAVLVIDPEITFENNANYVSAGMVVQNFLLRATELGIGTCPIAGFKGKEVLRRELDIPERYDIPLLIFFGYPKPGTKENCIPYRVPVNQVYSYNRYLGPTPFPISSSASEWRQDQVFDYRRRIMSVYFPRFGHSIWGKAYANAIWAHIAPYVLNEKKVLYIFPWELELLKNLNAIMSRKCLDIADANPELLNFTRETFPNLIDRVIDFRVYSPHKRYNTVLIIGSLEFNSDAKLIFEYASLSLAEGGNLIVATLRRTGLLGIGLKVSKLFGRQCNVYHNSLFYKLGPHQIYSTKYLLDLGALARFKLNNKSITDTQFIPSRFESRFMSKLFKLIPSKLHDTVIYHFIKE